MRATRPMAITGWIFTGLVVAFLLGPSAVGKFVDFPGKQEMFDHIGFSIATIKAIGVLEIIVALLYLIPRTSFLGAILLAGYLGGAAVAHVRIGEPFFIPIVLGVLAWVGLALRNPILFRLLIGKPVSSV